MGGRVREITLTIDAAGGAGVSVGSGVTAEILNGFFLEAYLNYHGSAPATTDVTIKQTGAPDNILVVTNNATDGLYAPRRGLVTGAGAAITDSNDRIPVAGTITVSIAQCDVLTAALVVTLRILTL